MPSTDLTFRITTDGTEALNVLKLLQDALAKTSKRGAAGNTEHARSFKDLEAKLATLTKGSREYLRVQNQIAALQNKMRAQVGGGLSGQLSRIGSDVNALGVRLPSVVNSLTQFVGGLRSIPPTAVAAAVGLTAVAAGVAGIGAAVAVGISALTALGRKGLEVNAQFETIELGIATVIGSVTDLRDATTGEAFADGPQKLAAATVIAADQMQKLRIDALETTATVAQIAPAFQAAIAPGVQAGLTFDQIRRATIDITNAVAALGLPLDQISQETRAILSGEINRNAQAAIALGFKREEVQEAIKAGKFADLLNEKLKVAAASGALAAKTFTGALSNLQEAGNIVAATVTKGLFDKLKESFNRVIGEIFDRDAANLISARFSGIADALTGVFDRVGEGAADAIDSALKAAADLSDFLKRNKREIDNILDTMDRITREVISLTARTLEWGRAILFSKDALSDIEEFFNRLEQDVAELNVLIESVLSGILLGIKFVALGALGAIEGIARIVGASGIADAARKEINRIVKDIEELDGRIRTAIGSYQELLALQETRRKLQEQFPDFTSGQAQRLLDVDKAPAGPPAPKTRKTLGGAVGDEASKGKGKTDAARKESQARIDLIEVEVKAAERLLEQETDAAERAYEQQTITATQMVARIIEAEQTLADVRKRLRDAERAQTEKLPEAERQVKLAQIREQELSDIADFNRRILRLRDEHSKKEDEAIREALKDAQDEFIAHQERLFDIAEIGRKQRADADRSAAEGGEISFAVAEDRAIKAERAAFTERERLAALERDRIGQSGEGREKAQDALKRLAAERAGFEEEATRRTREALERDRQAFERYVEARRQNEAELAQIRIDARAAEIAADLASLNPARRRKGLQEKVKLLKDEERERTKANREAIQRGAEEEVKAAVAAGKAVTDAALTAEINANQALEAERRRHAAEMGNIDREGKKEVAAVDPFSIRSLLGDAAGDSFEQTGSRIDAVLAALESKFTAITSAGQAMGAAINIGLSTVLDSLAAVGEGLANNLETWILTGHSAPLAIRKVLASELAAKSKQAAINAIYATATGFFKLAVWDFAGAANAFTSAAFYAAIAGGTALLGRAIAGKSDQQGGRDGDIRGTAGGGGETEEEERTFTRGTVEGLIGGFREVINPLVRGQDVLIQQQQAGFAQQQSLITQQQREQNAAIDRLARATGVFGEVGRKLQAIRAGELIVMAGEENPEAFSQATAKGVERSTNANRRLTSALNLDR